MVLSLLQTRYLVHSLSAIVTAIDSNLNKLLNSGILPRPMSLVSTISEDGVESLAPFSWFNTVTNYPPVISFAINHDATGSLKDTTANLKKGQGFAVNIISEAPPISLPEQGYRDEEL
ncbi:hypothetical protein EV424DRAFT_452839 [Suillus variegatus]|nr:hypothetical protein EV424DRAFT_452839 [Suillus variegatus]